MVHAAGVATGDILVFSDANNLYTPETLRAVVAPFADPSVGVVTGRKIIDDGTGRALDRAEGLYWRYESALKTWETATGSVAAVAGEIIAFRREAFRVTEQRFLVRGLRPGDARRASTAGASCTPATPCSVERASATLGDEADPPRAARDRPLAGARRPPAAVGCARPAARAGRSSRTRGCDRSCPRRS